MAALGHVAFFAPDLGFDVVLGARTDALAAHEVAALCERAVALGEGASDATAGSARAREQPDAARAVPLAITVRSMFVPRRDATTTGLRVARARVAASPSARCA